MWKHRKRCRRRWHDKQGDWVDAHLDKIAARRDERGDGSFDELLSKGVAVNEAASSCDDGPSWVTIRLPASARFGWMILSARGVRFTQCGNAWARQG